MFGYVTVNEKRLSKDEKNRFQRIYCGVCEDLRALCGARGRLTLTYDSAFLALVLTSLYEPEEKHSRLTCSAHPLVKHDCDQSEMTAYAADVNVLLSYYSLLDDWQDEGSKLKKAGAELLKKAFGESGARRPEKKAVIEEELGNLARLEKQGSGDIDNLAGCFGRLLGEMFVYKEDNWATLMRTAGDRLGRFIYILDAWKDSAKDRRNHAFNALSALREQSDYEERVFNMLTCEISLCAKALEALPLVQDINIIRNVIYSGVWTRYSRRRKPSKEGDK